MRRSDYTADHLLRPHLKPKVIRARFDATQLGHENRNHWGAADALGPNTANDSHVRNTICRRTRLERENDPHFYGMGKANAYSFVGTGPRLQLSLDPELYESARVFERLVTKWMRASNFAEKLRLMVECCPVDGEVFGQIVENPTIQHPIKIDLKVMEQEQVSTPGFNYFSENKIDGIETDAYGNPTIYHVLKTHPGDDGTLGMEYDSVPADAMLHWFRPYRPGQARGVSEFASSIETCAQTRRYAKATLGKQEINANITGVIESENVMVGDETAPTFETMEEVDIPRQGLMTMPAGMKAKPFGTAENTTGFKEYMGMNYAAIGRPLNIPRNLITGDSSDFNFASGRMDHLPYQSGLWVDRDRIRIRVLDKLLKILYAAASSLGLVPANLPRFAEWEWDWHWDGFASIDQVKDEAAREMRLKNGMSTLAEECAAEGKDWREVARQRATEAKFYKTLGLPDPYSIIAPPPAMPGDAPPDEQNDPPEVDAGYFDDTPLEPRRGRPAYV